MHPFHPTPLHCSLLPPVWLDWVSGWKPYDELQAQWNDTVARNPAAFGLADAPRAAPLIDGWDFNTPPNASTGRECASQHAPCRSLHQDTLLSWDWLVDLDPIADVVPLVDRWDMRSGAAQASLGLKDEDVFVLEDRVQYEMQISDRGPLADRTSPLLTDRWPPWPDAAPPAAGGQMAPHSGPRRARRQTRTAPPLREPVRHGQDPGAPDQRAPDQGEDRGSHGTCLALDRPARG